MPKLANQRLFLLQWLLLGLFLLSLGGYGAYVLSKDHRDIELQERKELDSRARIIEENLGRRLESINAALVHIRNDALIWKANVPGSTLAERELEAMANAMPAVRTLLVINADGTVFAANRPELRGANFSQRDYFQRAARNPDPATLYVGEPFATVLGVFAMNLTRVIAQPNGAFGGIVAATLDPNEFQILLDSVRYAPEVSAGLVHGNGKVFLYVPERPGTLGIDLSERGTFFSRHQASGQPASVITGFGKISRQESMAAFRTIQPATLSMDEPILVGVARPLAPIFALWRQRVYEQSLLFAALAVASIVGLMVSQQRQRQRQRAEAQLEQFFWLVPDLVCIASTDGYFLKINPAWTITLGHAEQELLSRPFIDFVHPDDRETTWREVAKLTKGEATLCFVNRYCRKDGDFRWLQWRATSDETRMSIFACAHDITLLKAQQAELEHIAYYDPLTGAPNRRLLTDRLGQAQARARRTGQTLAVCYLDLDGFKPVNDRYGHAAGDRLLMAMTERLKEVLRAEDTLARLGGDEFVLLLTGFDDPMEIRGVLDRILAVISAPLTLDQIEVCVSASIGVTLYPADHADGDGLLRHADQTMYRAKQAGKNCYCFYEPADAASGNDEAWPGRR